MTGLPARNEAADYYFRYIDRIKSDDIASLLRTQLNEVLPLLRGISEQKSLHRYASDKWTIRQVLNHINDCERVFVLRALWFARGFTTPLPSFDQNISVPGANADQFSWAAHVAEFEAIREASILFFDNLPKDAWTRSGIASDNRFTVRALAYIVAGHLDHHVAILKERYLSEAASEARGPYHHQ
jgi:DinB superfamily